MLRTPFKLICAAAVCWFKCQPTYKCCKMGGEEGAIGAEI